MEDMEITMKDLEGAVEDAETVSALDRSGGTCSSSHRGNGCVVWGMETALAQGEQEHATTMRLKFTVLLPVDIGAS